MLLFISELIGLQEEGWLMYFIVETICFVMAVVLLLLVLFGVDSLARKKVYFEGKVIWVYHVPEVVTDTVQPMGSIDGMQQLIPMQFRTPEKWYLCIKERTSGKLVRVRCDKGSYRRQIARIRPFDYKGQEVRFYKKVGWLFGFESGYKHQPN